MNSKGSTLTTWLFTIGMILLFLVILQTAILDPLNNQYNQSYGTGLNTSGLDELKNLKTSTDAEIEGAEVSSTSDGLTLTSAWTVGRAAYRTIVSFINGGFIYALVVDTLNFPDIVAQVLVVLIWLSLILIIIYIFMKVVP